MQNRPNFHRGHCPAAVSLLSSPGLLAALLVGAAAPARASTFISTSVTLPGDPTYGNTIDDFVVVTSTGVLTIDTGGSVTQGMRVEVS